MSSSYRFVLTDDAGRPIIELEKLAFVSYTRSTQGLETIQLGLPYEYHKARVPDVFKLDWRIDVWRSPEEGYPLRRERSYFLMKYIVYERIDGIKIIEFYGRSAIEILRRCVVGINSVPVNYSRTDSADDIMKDLVRNFLLPAATVFSPVPTFPADSTSACPEFTVDADSGSGASITYETNWGTNLLDALKSIKATTFTLFGQTPPVGRKVFFDVIEGPGLASGFGYIFKTFTDLRGQDRRSGGLIFSAQNGNISKPTFYESFLDSITLVTVANNGFSLLTIGSSSDRKKHSRWSEIIENRFFETSDVNALQTYADSVIRENDTQRVFSANFLNTPGGPTQPRSLYGVDWDLGDLVRAEFADQAFDCEIKIVYVSVDENGRENVIGNSEVNQ